MDLSQRLTSLDVFRGLTIAGMIVVNDPGSWKYVYPPLRHADWHGITPTDFVFPFFLFIVGVSIALAYSKRMGSVPEGQLIKKVLIRSAIIFGLGLFLALFPAFKFSEIRIPGVLQRIALVFLVCSLIFLKTNWRTQVWIAAGLLLGYWALMTLVPIPGQGPPDLGRFDGTFAAWLDRIIIPGRLYVENLHDPEGLVSTLPAIVTGLTGIFAGHLILSKLEPDRKLIWLMVGGFLAMTLGNVWDWFFPFNKNLWTSSYVMYTSGLAAMTLGAMYWFIDVKKFNGWIAPFQAFGANAITAYVLHGLLVKLMIHFEFPVNTYFMDWLMGWGVEPMFASLLWALLYTFLCFIPIWIMYKRRIFIKI